MNTVTYLRHTTEVRLYKGRGSRSWDFDLAYVARASFLARIPPNMGRVYITLISAAHACATSMYTEKYKNGQTKPGAHTFTRAHTPPLETHAHTHSMEHGRPFPCPIYEPQRLITHSPTLLLRQWHLVAAHTLYISPASSSRTTLCWVDRKREGPSSIDSSQKSILSLTVSQ